MKFNYYLVLLLTTLAIFYSSVGSVTLLSKSEAATKVSIMEFLNNLYKSSTNEQTVETTENSHAHHKHGKHGHHHGHHHSHNRRMNELVTDNSELSILKEGWLRISSPSFTNENIFPRVFKPNFKPDYIDVSEGSTFRVNNLYDKDNRKNHNYPPNSNSFYFRLSNKNLWYAIGKKNLEALGSIPVHSIYTAEEATKPNKKASGAFCFFIKDKIHADWELCAETNMERLAWMCKIYELKRIKEDKCRASEIKKQELADVPVTVFERHVTQPIILIPQPNRFCNDNWNYENQGTDWECDCIEGKEQSPINIVRKNAITSPVFPVFTYTEVEVKTTQNADDGQVKGHSYVKIVNEDHLLQINADSFGTVVTLDGTSYNANKVVFHTPSEHLIDGVKYPMEMQIIHDGSSTGAITKHVVLSFLFKTVPGVYNKFLDDIDFFNLPSRMNNEKKLIHDLYIPKIFYNSADQDIPIMKKFSFFTYQGSLTTPPCSQKTIHYVAADPIEIGSTAIQLFQEAIKMPDMRSSKGDIIQNTDTTENARKVQPLNGRNVFYFHVKKEEISQLKKEYLAHKEKPRGHYEKVMKKINNYYYVNNNNPSGMPGSIVVSEKEAKGFGSS